MEEQAESQWLWCGKHVKLMDGSTLSMPDTPKNQKLYPQPGTQKKRVGFPIARIVGIISLATASLLDLAISPYSSKETGEHALLRQLLHVFQSGDVVLGDCYYASFFLISMLMQMDVDAVFPMHASRDRDFRRSKRLGKKDHLVNWKKPAKPKWMDLEAYNAFLDTITVREVVVGTGNKGSRSKARITIFFKVKVEELQERVSQLSGGV